MKSYACERCGWIYSPETGDPEGGAEAGTMFEELPDEWTCPDCSSPKKNFSPVDE